MRGRSPESIEKYKRDGVMILRGVFSPSEMDAVARETTALLERSDLMDAHNLRVRWQYHYETAAPVFELFDPVTDIAPACRAIADDARIHHLLEALLGEPAILFKDKLIYK